MISFPLKRKGEPRKSSPNFMESRLTLIQERVEIKNCKVYNLYQCSCGNITKATKSAVDSGNTKSCGCLREENKTVKYINDNPIYKVWLGMKSRCYNSNTANYRYYGGKGIKVCDEWKNDFENFERWALANGYAKGLTIDRENGKLDYMPSNCRWVTMKVQNSNRAVPKHYNKK